MNREVGRMVAEEQMKVEAAQVKKKELYESMQQQYTLKQEVRMAEMRRDQEELEKINQYQSGLDQKDKRQREEMIKREKEREAIYYRMKAAEEQRKKELEQL